MTLPLRLALSLGFCSALLSPHAWAADTPSPQENIKARVDQELHIANMFAGDDGSDDASGVRLRIEPGQIQIVTHTKAAGVPVRILAEIPVDPNDPASVRQAALAAVEILRRFNQAGLVQRPNDRPRPAVAARTESRDASPQRYAPTPPLVSQKNHAQSAAPAPQPARPPGNASPVRNLAMGAGLSFINAPNVDTSPLHANLVSHIGIRRAFDVGLHFLWPVSSGARNTADAKLRLWTGDARVSLNWRPFESVHVRAPVSPYMGLQAGVQMTLSEQTSLISNQQAITQSVAAVAGLHMGARFPVTRRLFVDAMITGGGIASRQKRSGAFLQAGTNLVFVF